MDDFLHTDLFDRVNENSKSLNIQDAEFVEIGAKSINKIWIVPAFVAGFFIGTALTMIATIAAL